MKEIKTIKIFVVPVGKDGEVKTIPNTLESLQKVVGGFIETVSMPNNLVLVCDEEGRIKGKLPNVTAGGSIIVGDCFITRAGMDGEFIDLNDTDVQVLTKVFRRNPVKVFN